MLNLTEYVKTVIPIYVFIFLIVWKTNGMQ